MLSKTILGSSMKSNRGASYSWCRMYSHRMAGRCLNSNLTSYLLENVENLRIMSRNAYRLISRKKRERSLINLEDRHRNNNSSHQELLVRLCPHLSNKQPNNKLFNRSSNQFRSISRLKPWLKPLKSKASQCSSSNSSSSLNSFRSHNSSNNL